MSEVLCDYCGESVDEAPIRRGQRVYCSEACAFEAKRSQDCSGRSDSVMSRGSVHRPKSE